MAMSLTNPPIKSDHQKLKWKAPCKKMQGVLLFLMVDFFEGKFVSAVNNAITAKRVTKKNCISFSSVGSSIQASDNRKHQTESATPQGLLNGFTKEISHSGHEPD
jgi:hypothetical protein